MAEQARVPIVSILLELLEPVPENMHTGKGRSEQLMYVMPFTNSHHHPFHHHFNAWHPHSMKYFTFLIQVTIIFRSLLHILPHSSSNCVPQSLTSPYSSSSCKLMEWMNLIHLWMFSARDCSRKMVWSDGALDVNSLGSEPLLLLLAKYRFSIATIGGFLPEERGGGMGSVTLCY